MNKISSIVLNNDIVEIFHNELLKNKPYLIRWTNYSNETYELRADVNDLRQLGDILDDIADSDPDSTMVA